MATALDALFGTIAKTLTSQFGLDASLYGSTGTSFDTSTGKQTQTWAAARVVKISPPSPYKIQPGQTAQVQTPGAIGSLFVTVVAAQDTGLSGYAPKNGDRLTIGSRTHRVVSVEPILSGENVAAYQLVVEGSGVTP